MGIEGVEDFERRILMEIGALDKGDQLRNGEVPCILLTEDTDINYINILAESSGFVPDEYQVWSYNGCSNISIAQALNSFIAVHAPGTAVVVHRDRDYMTDDEVDIYKEKLEKVGIKVFITSGNDAESHFLNEKHISELYPAISSNRVTELIDECLKDNRDKILQKYINTIHNRQLQESYKGGDKPNAGMISIECTKNVDSKSRQYLHGKTIEKSLRSKLQAEIGENIVLCKNSKHLANHDLQKFAAEIWSDDDA